MLKHTLKKKRNAFRLMGFCGSKCKRSRKHLIAFKWTVSMFIELSSTTENILLLGFFNYFKIF